MKSPVAYLRDHPKTAILALLIAAFAIAATWNATRQQQRALSLSYGGIAPTMGVSESAIGAPGMAYADSKLSMPSVDSYMVPPSPYPPTAGKTAAEVDQKIIKNGYLQLVVNKVADSASRVIQIATSRGGFVQSSTVTERGDGTYNGTIDIRVPVVKFEESMSEIKKLATLVKSDTSTGQDVTEQYSDLQAQLRNAKAQEETYLAILKQARTVEETLKVQEQIGIIRGQIESLQGRIQYLTNSTSYSSINISLEEEPVVRAPTKEFRLWSIIKEATQTLVAAIQYIIAGLIWAVIVWGGILLPVGLLLWIILTLWKRRASPKKR
jgi:transcription antitermination factor NusG